MEQGNYLKDRNGNPINYGGLIQVKIPGYGADGQEFIYTYTRIPQLDAYAYQQEGEYFRILAKLDYFPLDNCILFGVYDSEVEQYGEYASSGGKMIKILVTPKYFKIGELYTQAELLGGL